MQAIRGSKSEVRYRRVPLNIGWVIVRIVVNDLQDERHSPANVRSLTSTSIRPLANSESDTNFPGKDTMIFQSYAEGFRYTVKPHR